MPTLVSAAVFGLVATPMASPADPVGDVHRAAAHLRELEEVHTCSGANTCIDTRRDVMRSAGYLIAASIFSSLFIGTAFAGIVLSSFIHSQSPRSAAAR